MVNRFFALSAAALVSACQHANAPAPQIVYRVPVAGAFSDGQDAAGEVMADSRGNGHFWVQSPGGRRCEGDYRATVPQASFVVPVDCRGVRGEVVATRQLDGVSGVAIARLENGVKARFVYGDITFSHTTPDGGTVSAR